MSKRKRVERRIQRVLDELYDLGMDRVLSEDEGTAAGIFMAWGDLNRCFEELLREGAESERPRLVRNESTEEGRRIWAAVDKVADRCSEKMKERLISDPTDSAVE